MPKINFSATVGVFVFALLLLPLGANARLSDAQKMEVKFALNQNTATEFLATVDLQKQRFRFATFIPDFESPTTGLIRQRSLMGWKGDYLFIRHQCGQLAEWRCIVDQVFTRIDNRLIHVGMVESASCKELGCRYQPETGLFTDLYDVYQVNPVTGATDTPPLPIIRRVSGNTLVTDLDETWKLNRDAYQASIACLDLVAKSGFDTPCAQGQTPWSALVFAAKLTHYTNRITERDALFAKQAVAYCAKSADPKCQWRVAGARDFFQRFAQGANPVYVPSPVTLTSTTINEPKMLMPQKLETGKAIKLKL